MKKKFIVEIYSSEEDISNITAETLQYEIYENVRNIDTVHVKEVPFE